MLDPHHGPNPVVNIGLLCYMYPPTCTQYRYVEQRAQAAHSSLPHIVGGTAGAANGQGHGPTRGHGAGCAAPCVGGQAAQRSKTERGSGASWIDDRIKRHAFARECSESLKVDLRARLYTNYGFIIYTQVRMTKYTCTCIGRHYCHPDVFML